MRCVSDRGSLRCHFSHDQRGKTTANGGSEGGLQSRLIEAGDTARGGREGEGNKVRLAG